jgi:transcription factor C subunit 6
MHLGQFIDGKESHVLYAGSPVWALDWCPTTAEFEAGMIWLLGNEQLFKVVVEGGYKQYLAVAPLRSSSQLVTMTRPPKEILRGSIQIWTYSRDKDGPTCLSCDLVLCLDFGIAMNIKWCPLPSHSLV